MKENDDVEEILSLYRQLDERGNKGFFIEAAAKRFSKSKATIEIHWLRGKIPKRYHRDIKKLVLELLDLQEKHRLEKEQLIS